MTDYRKDFPLLSEIGEHTVDGREWIYIDNAATSQRPQCVIDAERDFYLKHNANPLRGNYPPAHGILLHACVQNRVGHRVTDLIRMSFCH